MSDVAFRFEGRTAVVTGAAGGLGGAVARLFRASGANVVAADLHVDGLDRSLQEVTGTGGIETVAVDVSSSQDDARLVRTAVDRFGGIDFLIPFAGVIRNQPATETTDDDWRFTLSINLDGVFYLVREAVPVMGEGGAVVTVASMAGHRGARRSATYGASKGAIVALTRSLAWELAPKGIRINGVSPGLIETPLSAVAGSGGRSAEVVADTPLRRAGVPEEVAGVVAFLCSDAASFVHGELVHINGGYHMAG